MTLNDFVFSLIHKLLVLLNFLMTNSLSVFLFWLDLSSVLCMKSLRLLYRYHVFRHSWWTQYKSQQGTRNLPTLVELIGKDSSGNDTFPKYSAADSSSCDSFCLAIVLNYNCDRVAVFIIVGPKHDYTFLLFAFHHTTDQTFNKCDCDIISSS